MSGFANPRKDFRYLLELDGANSFLIQEVTLPTLEFPVIKHGAPINVPDAKTPGKLMVGDLVVKKLKPALTADVWAEDWMAQAIGGFKKDFIKTGFLKDLGPDGVSTIQRWFLGDVWPYKIEYGTRKSLGPGENVIDTVTFCVQFCVPEDSPLFAGLLAGGGAVAGGIAFAAGISG